MAVKKSFILTISCLDKIGIVAVVSTFLASQKCFIEESSHYGDPSTGYFFMRTRFLVPIDCQVESIASSFEGIARDLELSWDLWPMLLRPKVLVMCSKQDHCVRDLLYRAHSGRMNMEISAVVSNHKDLAEICGWYKIPFYHVPVVAEGKVAAEERLQKIVEDSQAELIVLARYMQILSAEFCASHPGRIINIHHSFLPSFKGAKPYHRAHAQGVKLIGATAHYVTADLDEGPIIEQDVVRVNHTHSIDELVSLGKDVEAQTLSKAVQYHLERRVFIDKGKTVVFKN
jgi:formyltetrahydrofolate deformylase